MYINLIHASYLYQKKGTKRRVKSTRGSIRMTSDKGVSIPQITYDHIDDSQEKKDSSYFEEPSGTVEGIHWT